jgi:transposase-like protein
MSKDKPRRVGQPHDGAFKRQAVQELQQGERELEELAQAYQVSRVTLWRWKKAYERRGEAAFATSLKPGRPKGPGSIPGVQEEPKALPKGAQARIAELERLCGRLTLENELLKKVVGRAASKSDTL